MMNIGNRLLMIFLLFFKVPGYAQEEKPLNAGGHWVSSELLDPRKYPDDGRRHVKPPSWELFGNQPHFTTMRRFQVKDGKLVNYAEDFERYTKKFDLGDVIWPNSSFLTTTNLPEMVGEMKRRGLFMYQIWGYVPGSGAGTWHQFKLSKETSGLFSSLGDQWLGMDMGEQDGRYLLGYAGSMSPRAANRFEQYLNFHRHMGRIGNDMDNKMATLTAVTYAHYLVKEGIYTLVGAEAAQMHPNGQVFYAFNRGAGKQYGVPWFGNASVFNRWGWKTYGQVGEKNGPAKGTSLSLLKRLLYSHLLYNCMVVGFESGWIDRDKLSPIGKIQQAAQRWVRKNPSLGVHQTPVGVMTDFYSGWIFPNYNNILYRVWGNIPYGPGDYLTNNVFDLLYPGYQVSSFYHDETGFVTATPYGDNADALLSDAPGWILKRYPLLIVAGELSGGAEIKDKLQDYVDSGGHLMITAGSLQKLPGGVAGIQVTGEKHTVDSVETIHIGDTIIQEKDAFELMPLQVPAGSATLASVKNEKAVVRRQSGKGTITVFASPFGSEAQPQLSVPIVQKEDTMLPNPYPLLNHVRIFLERALEAQKLFDVGKDLSLITCRRQAGEYILGIGNNTWDQRLLTIVSRVGEIRSIKEMKLDQSEKDYPEYRPESLFGKNIGRSDRDNIAGGDFRIFVVTVDEKNVRTLSKEIPAKRSFTKILPLRRTGNVQEEVLARPTFFQHFDGVLLDWRYLHERERKMLQEESGWLALQKLQLWVDLSSGINLFPDLRLVNNIEPDYRRSMETIKDVIDKMKILGSRNLVLSLHTNVENNISSADTWRDFEKSMREICQYAGSDITVFLKGMEGNKLPRSLNELVEFVTKTDQPNLKLALNTAALLDAGVGAAVLQKHRDMIGVWLIGAPRRDLANRLWDINSPVYLYNDRMPLENLLRVAPQLPIVSDILFEDKDEEYKESIALDGLMSKVSP